jgi:hypothetical protein
VQCYPTLRHDPYLTLVLITHYKTYIIYCLIYVSMLEFPEREQMSKKKKALQPPIAGVTWTICLILNRIKLTFLFMLLSAFFVSLKICWLLGTQSRDKTLNPFKVLCQLPYYLLQCFPKISQFLLKPQDQTAERKGGERESHMEHLNTFS